MHKIFLTIFMVSTIVSCSNNINSTDDAKNAMKEKYPNKINKYRENY